LVIHIHGAQTEVYREQENELVPFTADLVYLHGFSHGETRQFIAHFCHDTTIKFLNSENMFTSPTSKLNQYYLFSKNGVSCPETVVCYPKTLLHSIVKTGLELPLIIKSTHGRGGEDNYRVQTHQEVVTLVGKLNESQTYAIQPFIENDGDFRVILYKDTIIACYKRSRTDMSDHRNNVRQGATRALIDPVPVAVSELAIKAAKSLRRELTGVDVIENNGQFYVLESNFNFGLKGEGDGVVPYVLEHLADIFHDAAA
jgi:glutathione synthase/RimK-type ligase-like ATP-grasp enzyme